jgi:hypothetical protein
VPEYGMTITLSAPRPFMFRIVLGWLHCLFIGPRHA